MIRVLYTIPNLTTAGSGRALFEVARRLDRSRFHPGLAIGTDEPSPLRSTFENEGIPVLAATTTVPARPLLSLPARVRRAARHYEHGYWHVWHSFHYLDDYTEPLIARAAGARAWVYTKKNMSWNHRSWWLRSWLARRIAVQNRGMMTRFFSPWWLRRRARLVPRGVDCERFRPATARPQSPAGQLVVGCVGHLCPRKNQRLLIEAVARVPGVTLRLAGRALDPAYVAELEALVRSAAVAERVRFEGEVADIPYFLQQLDAHALVSLAEGSPVALLEAMATGLPVVVSRIPGSSEVVEHERSGFVVGGDRVDDLAGALQVLRDQPETRLRLGAAARARVLDNSAIQRETADHAALYVEAMGSRANGAMLS